MNGISLLIDTNIVLYLLSGDDTLTDFLQGKKIYISIITEIELLSYHSFSDHEIKKIKQFIWDCFVLPIDNSIKENAIHIRRKYKRKLPDSIIIASAISNDLPLLSADSDFIDVEELNLIHYLK